MALRILMVLGSLDYCNGITSYAMNYYNNLNKDDYKIDFAVHYNFDSEYKEKIETDGNKVFFMGDYSIKSLITLRKRIKKLYENNKYDIVHCHILNLAWFYLSIAKKCGITSRIIHSHATKNSDNFYKNIRNKFLKKFGLKYANQYFACSDLAGKYLFGKKKYEVILNAIDYKKFGYSEIFRKKLMAKYNIDSSIFVLGFVGRFTHQKNIPFLLDVFYKLRNKNFNFKAFIIGDGKEKQYIQNYISSHDLTDFVFLVESNPNIFEYYSLFDLFLLPSFFEGLPVTGVEAQVAGCGVICSDRITEELNFSFNCLFLPINNVNIWVEKIYETKKNIDRNNISNKYDIKQNVTKLEHIYMNCVKKS